MKTLRKIELLLLVAGGVFIAIYIGARIHGMLFSRAAVQAFTAVHQLSPASQRKDEVVKELTAAPPDFVLWSTKRIRDYEESLTKHLSPAVAILRIPKINLEVPVLEGTEELALNRGVGRIPGTALVGNPGNIGIAGHRDGFFRGLKDVTTGDTIELLTSQGSDRYLIDRILIVSPGDTSVLQPRTERSLTLVTCYPFYFIGSAPQRYIVQAVIAPQPRSVAHMNQP